MKNLGDLTLIKKWLMGLNGQTFVVMDPPTHDRFTLEDGLLGRGSEVM